MIDGKNKDIKTSALIIDESNNSSEMINKNINYICIKNTREETRVYVKSENGKNKLMIELNINDNKTIEITLAGIIGL